MSGADLRCIRWSVRIEGNHSGVRPPDGYVWARNFEEAVAEARKTWRTGRLHLTPLGAGAWPEKESAIGHPTIAEQLAYDYRMGTTPDE